MCYTIYLFYYFFATVSIYLPKNFGLIKRHLNFVLLHKIKLLFLWTMEYTEDHWEPITLFDLMHTLQKHKKIIPSHSVYAVNMERIISQLHHHSRDDWKCAKISSLLKYKKYNYVITFWGTNFSKLEPLLRFAQLVLISGIKQLTPWGCHKKMPLFPKMHPMSFC